MAEKQEEHEEQEEIKSCQNCKTIIPEPFVDFVPSTNHYLFCCAECLADFTKEN